MASKRTAVSLRGLKGSARIVCVTAYDFPSATIADAAGVDLILVGDSLGNTVLGYENTLPVSLDEIEHHTKAVRRGVKDALLVADLPFGSYQTSVEQAVESSIRLVKAGAEAVKLEGAYSDQIKAIVRAGVPVMGHVGMTPQSVNAFGGFKVQGKGDGATAVREAACQVQEAGAFSIVLELIPHGLARTISSELDIPTIGIGAGPHCDGEIQVYNDLVGLSSETFRHAKRYADARNEFIAGLTAYAREVREKQFPTEDNSF